MNLDHQLDEDQLDHVVDEAAAILAGCANRMVVLYRLMEKIEDKLNQTDMTALRQIRVYRRV